MSDLHGRTLSGISWLTFGQMTKHALQFVLGIILARLLTPHEFGLVGLVMVFIGFAGLFSELGFGAALIQRKEIDERHWSSVFWVNIAAGFALTGLFMAIAPLVGQFYDEPILAPLTTLFAVSFAVGSLSMVPIAKLTRDMDFRALALIETTAAVLSGILAVVLALVGFGVWSLVWRTIAVTTLTAVGMWWVTRWRPRWMFDPRAVRELLGFSSNLLGYRAINYWVQNGNDLIIGRFLGTSALGIYSRAYLVLLLPLNEVVRILGRVMFPALSRLQHDVTRVRESYLHAVAMLSVFLFPAMLGLSAVSGDFVLALYGPRWEEVIPILGILSVLAVPQSLVATAGWIFQSQGRTDWIFRWGIVSAGATMLSIGIGISIGNLLAVVTCYAVTSGLLLLYPAISIPGRLIDMRFRDVVSAVSGSLVCSVVMAIAVWLLAHILPDSWPHWLRLLSCVSAGAVLYLVLIHLAQVKAYRDSRLIALGVMRQFMRPPTAPEIAPS